MLTLFWDDMFFIDFRIDLLKLISSVIYKIILLKSQ